MVYCFLDQFQVQEFFLQRFVPFYFFPYSREWFCFLFVFRMLNPSIFASCLILILCPSVLYCIAFILVTSLLSILPNILRVNFLLRYSFYCRFCMFLYEFFSGYHVQQCLPSINRIPVLFIPKYIHFLELCLCVFPSSPPCVVSFISLLSFLQIGLYFLHFQKWSQFRVSFRRICTEPSAARSRVQFPSIQPQVSTQYVLNYDPVSFFAPIPYAKQVAASLSPWYIYSQALPKLFFCIEVLGVLSVLL